jgi:signal transduction histidine kinase
MTLPRRTIRLRLTLLYAGLFLISGAILLTITYVVVDNHVPRLLGIHAAATGQQLQAPVQIGGPSVIGGASAGGGTSARGGGSVGGGSAGGGGFSAGLPGSVKSATEQYCVSTAGGSSQPGGGYTRCVAFFRAQDATLGADYLDTLLVGSGIALGVMTVAALGLGWLVSGRVLSPLRTITSTARNISASNLHERLALGGPDDELKELGDTVDALLARLEGSFAAQRQFVANASHELRTPLARQRTIVEVALADPDRSVASLEAACSRVLAAGQQQERLIEALLTLARSQRGLDHFEPVDLASVTRQASMSRVADAAARQVALIVQADAAAFGGDTRLTERLVANLLDNALRHNVPGGQVTVRTLTAGDDAVLTVLNTGPQIEPDQVAGLFEPFRHGHTRRTGDGESLGLGLSIVAAIAAAHQASLHAVAAPAGGLAIEVRFPAVAAAAPPAEMARWPGPLAAGPPTAESGQLVSLSR